MAYETTELAKFSRAGRAIAKSANVSFETWARGEMGVVLKMWAARTPMVTETKATIEARSKANKKAGTQTAGLRKISVNTGERGGLLGLMWFHTKNDRWQNAGTVDDSGHIFDSWLHFAKDDWDRIATLSQKFANAVARTVPAAKKAIGLARQSVIQSADALGIAIEQVQGGSMSGADIARARSAIATNGIRYQNGTGKESRGPNGYSIEFSNTYPLNAKTKMDLALMGVLQTRMRQYDDAIVRGVFKDLHRIEQEYPYIKVA